MSNQLKEKIMSYPEEIRKLSFCNWKSEKRDGNSTKVPYNPLTGARAQVDTPGTFSTLEKALEALPRYDGIGIRVSGNVDCIDLDDSVLPDGTLTENAQDVLSMLLNIRCRPVCSIAQDGADVKGGLPFISTLDIRDELCYSGIRSA